MNEAIYIGAGLDLQPIKLFKNLKKFHYIDSQPFSEFGNKKYILSNGQNAFYKPNFIRNLDFKMNKNYFKLIKNNNNIRIYSNNTQIIFYYINISIPENFNKIKNYIKNVDTIIIIEHDPHNIFLNHIKNNNLIFIGNNNTFYKNNYNDILNSTIYKINNTNFKNKFNYFYLIFNKKIIKFKNWNKFLKKSLL